MKKCKACLGYKEKNLFPIKDHTTMARSKICIECNPHQKDVPVPLKAIVYVCGYYDKSVDQRYVKFGYTTKSAEARLGAVIKSWEQHCNEIPYAEILFEVEVDVLKSYKMEQKILRALKEEYSLSTFHKGMNIEGKKETFIVSTKEEAKEFVDKINKLIATYRSEGEDSMQQEESKDG